MRADPPRRTIDARSSPLLDSTVARDVGAMNSGMLTSGASSTTFGRGLRVGNSRAAMSTARAAGVSAKNVISGWASVSAENRRVQALKAGPAGPLRATADHTVS